MAEDDYDRRMRESLETHRQQSDSYWRGLNNIGPQRYDAFYQSGESLRNFGRQQPNGSASANQSNAHNSYSHNGGSPQVNHFNRTYITGYPTAGDTRLMQWRHKAQFELALTIPALMALPFSPGYTVAAIGGGILGYAGAKIAIDIVGRDKIERPSSNPLYVTMETVEGNKYNQTIISKSVHISKSTQISAWSGVSGKIAGAGLLWLSGIQPDALSNMVTSAYPLLISMAGVASVGYVVLRDASKEVLGWKTVASSLLGAGMTALGIYAGALSLNRSNYYSNSTEITANAYVVAPKKLKLRDAPLGNEIGELSCGDEVNADLPIRQWTHVRLGDGRQGYAGGKYLSTREPSCSPS